MIPDLYFCAGDNVRFAEIAIQSGLRYGAQIPTRVHFPILFADQNWKRPDRTAYLSAVRIHRPHLATVLDWERTEQLDEVLSWAEEVAALVDVVIVVPKVIGGIEHIPDSIGGRPVRLGRPVGPHESEAPPVWEYGIRPVHLLGGSPHRQMMTARYLNVLSVDCSVTAAMACRKAAFWTPRRLFNTRSRWWAQLQEIGLGNLTDAPYEAFARSCAAIFEGWQLWERGII
jgi:hypothetical protein